MRKSAPKASDAAKRAKEERARAELLALASEKLGRSLTEEEESEVRMLEGEYLTSGYYAKLYSGYKAQELLEWFSSVAEVRKELAEIQHSRDAITKEQLEKARAKVVKIATAKLGRALTAREQQVIRGFDKWLLAEGEIAGLYRDFTPQQMLKHFAEHGAGSGPVALLESLATAHDGVEAGREQILEYLSPGGRRILGTVDFAAILEELSGWLLHVLRKEPPGRKTRALYFGLFESGGGCQLYVSGANAYDKEDSDWACTVDWSPKGRHAPFTPVSKLWGKLKRCGDEPWVVVQAVATIMVRAFFENHHAEFRELTGFKRVYVACGFDDGDLYELRTPFSPKA